MSKKLSQKQKVHREKAAIKSLIKRNKRKNKA